MNKIEVASNKLPAKIALSSCKSLGEFLNILYRSYQLNNPKFGIKEFGEKIGIHSRTKIMMVLQGKRKLSKKDRELIASNLDLETDERARFLSGSFQNEISDISIPNTFLAPKDFFSDLSNVLVLNICGLKEGVSSKELTDAVKFLLNSNQLEKAISYLMDLKLIDFQHGRYKRVFEGNITTQGYLAAAEINNFNIQALGLMKSLTEIDPVNRELQSFVVRLNEKDLPTVKTIVRECRQKIAMLSKGKESDSVYLANLGIMPMYKLESEIETPKMSPSL